MSPSKVQARKMVLVGAFLLAAVAIYKDRRDSTETADTFRTLWGVGVASLVLSVLADFVPQIAGPFAGLLVLGSLTNGGDQLIEKALGKMAAGPSTVAPASTPAPPASSIPDNRRGGR